MEYSSISSMYKARDVWWRSSSWPLTPEWALVVSCCSAITHPEPWHPDKPWRILWSIPNSTSSLKLRTAEIKRTNETFPFIPGHSKERASLYGALQGAPSLPSPHIPTEERWKTDCELHLGFPPPRGDLGSYPGIIMLYNYVDCDL